MEGQRRTKGEGETRQDTGRCSHRSSHDLLLQRHTSGPGLCGKTCLVSKAKRRRATTRLSSKSARSFMHHPQCFFHEVVMLCGLNLKRLLLFVPSLRACECSSLTRGMAPWGVRPAAGRDEPDTSASDGERSPNRGTPSPSGGKREERTHTQTQREQNPRHSSPLLAPARMFHARLISPRLRGRMFSTD